MAAGFLAAAAITVWAGDNDFIIPAANGNGWTEMASTLITPIPFAILAAGSLHSSMAPLETAASGRLLRAEATHMAVALATTIALLGTITAITGSAIAAAEAIRNLALYTGLALLSGRLFGRTLSWILPLADFTIIDFWGSDGLHPHWYAWQFQTYADAASWAAAGAWLITGIVAFALPPRAISFTWRHTSLRLRGAYRRTGP
jgi:hypothetical protein